MLEKNKDYIEMCVSSTNCTFIRNTVKLSIEGYVDSPLCWHLPDPVEPYVIISKEKFKALQTENEQLKKKLEECEKDYKLKMDKSVVFEQEVKILDRALKEWKEVTCCSTPEEAKNWVNELGETNGNLAKTVLSWQEITGFSTPEKCSSYIDILEKKLEDIKDLIEED